MSKTYVVADIHGRFDLLDAALTVIEKDSPEGGTFICLGDFVDRGPDSRSVIECLMGAKPEGWEWIILQGNHEDIMLQAIDNPLKLNWWIGNGGGATLKSYDYKVPGDHIDWLQSLPVTHEDEHRIYVHAGVPVNMMVEQVAKETLQWMLYREDQEEVWEDDATYFNDFGMHISGKHIVHGHHQSASHPLLKPHRTNLDSFAWYTGRLAIGVFDDEIPGGPVKVMSVEMEAYEY